MAPSIVSVALSLLLLLFFAVNISNIVTGRQARSASESHAEIPTPRNVYTGLAAIGTLTFFLFSLVYAAAGLTGSTDPLGFATVALSPLLGAALTQLGFSLLAAGVLLFAWSVVARGRYSVSWEMPEDHRLVTWGPYRYVRHPSYAGYFLMFIGLPLLTHNTVHLLPLMAVPGYVHLVEAEERLLAARFGDEYHRYAESTGRFIPKFHRSGRRGSKV